MSQPLNSLLGDTNIR